MVESSRLVFKVLCVKLKNLYFDFIMYTTTQFNHHHNDQSLLILLIDHYLHY